MWKQLDQQNKELEEKRKQFEKEKAQYEEEQKSNDKKGLERSDSSSRSLKYVFNQFKMYNKQIVLICGSLFAVLIRSIS